MNASILTLTNAPPAIRPDTSCGESRVRPAPRYQARQLRKPEADRAFEAGVQWFLEVSRKA
jgi:hypothetical protein